MTSSTAAAEIGESITSLKPQIKMMPIQNTGAMQTSDIAQTAKLVQDLSQQLDDTQMFESLLSKLDKLKPLVNAIDKAAKVCFLLG